MHIKFFSNYTLYSLGKNRVMGLVVREYKSTFKYITHWKIFSRCSYIAIHHQQDMKCVLIALKLSAPQILFIILWSVLKEMNVEYSKNIILLTGLNNQFDILFFVSLPGSGYKWIREPDRLIGKLAFKCSIPIIYLG